MFKRAVITAIVVGSVLTVINQVDAVFGPAELVIWQALLSTAVPFIVSLVSAYLTLRHKAAAGGADPVELVIERLNTTRSNLAQIVENAKAANAAGHAQDKTLEDLMTAATNQMADGTTALSEVMGNAMKLRQDTRDAITRSTTEMELAREASEIVQEVTARLKHPA